MEPEPRKGLTRILLSLISKMLLRLLLHIKAVTQRWLRPFWDIALDYLINYPWTTNSIGVAISCVTILAVGILGIKFILGVIFFLVAFTIGLSLRFFHDFVAISNNDNSTSVPQQQFPNTERQLEDNTLERSTASSTGSTGSNAGTGDELPKTSKPRPKLDMRITGSALIDETIHEMIDYILRDYVHIWYDHITDNDEFIYELRKSIQTALVTLSSRIKEVDWIPYLTTNLVDDAATHLRLFRSALVKLKDNPNSDLISLFFDLEASMEKNLCRDMVCTDESHMADYFQGLTEVLLYLILPHEVYNCAPAGVLAQDLLVNHVFIPVMRLLSDPDFVNQTIIWLCHDFTVPADIYMNVISTSDSLDELFAAQGFFNQQVAELKKALEHTNSSDEISTLRQQLKCLAFVRKRVEHQLSILKEGKSRDWIYDTDGDEWQAYFMQPGLKLHTLTLEEVFKNSVALSYFLDFMSSIGENHYLLMYLNADAWRVSAEQQLVAIDMSNRTPQHGKDQTKNHQEMLDCMRDAAFNVYEQFLSEKATPRVKLGESVVKKFYVQVRTEPITAGLFDQIQEALIETLQVTDKFYPAFTRNKLYVKCLMELDLLKAETVSAHSQSSASDEEDDDDIIHVDKSGDVLDSRRRKKSSFDANFRTITDDFTTCRECLKIKNQEEGLTAEDLLIWERTNLDRTYRIKAEIIEVALTAEKGTTFGVYVIQATKKQENGGLEKEWHIYRRYSDFYDFHQWIKAKWMRLSKLDFPSKQTFGKTDRAFLEKRMTSLNKYLESILITTGEPCFGTSLQDSLLHFLEPRPYVNRRRQFSDKIDSFVSMTVNPLKQSVKTVTHAVKTMPDTLFNTVDTAVTKIFNSKNTSSDFTEALKVGAALDTETVDNIPLRIILLLMDEVFDLKSRNQWLRRRIVVLIRQIVKTMMGDNLNRRIVDYVALLTSPVRVCGYLKHLQHTLWPEGRQITPAKTRDADTKFRTRIGAKAALLSSLSDELKHVIGSETTRRGLLCVFDLCQNRVLNRRLLLVLLEGIIKTLYPDKPLASLIQRLHYRSNRVGKYRPFLLNNSPTAPPATVPNATKLKSCTLPIMAAASLSPRGTRKRKS